VVGKPANGAAQKIETCQARRNRVPPQIIRMVYTYEKTESGEYCCPHCNIIKKNQTTMHMHYKANHDGALKQKCKDCNYETATKQALENHIKARHPQRMETQVKKFKCPCLHDEAVCSFESLTKAGLRSHYIIRHLSNYVTTYIGKASESEKPSCTCCGLEFTSKPAFIYHLVNCLPATVLNDPMHRAGLGLAAFADTLKVSEQLIAH